MLRTYGQIEEAKRTALTCQSIFVLAWMHALLQERRTYIPQAWTKFYEFSNADVRVARVLIEQLTGQGGKKKHTHHYEIFCNFDKLDKFSFSFQKFEY